MQRLATGLVTAPLALVAVFTLPADAFFGVALLAISGAALEYARLARYWTPSAPLGLLPLLVVAASGLAFAALRTPGEWSGGALGTIASGFAAIAAAPALTILVSRTRIAEAGIAIGLLAFGLPYFTAAVLATYAIHRADPWLLVALLAIIWAGDTAAYAIGSRFGRHKMAPTVSPNKSWEGAVAGLLASVAAAAGWSAWRLGTVDGRLLALAAITAVAGQAGDLVESLFKRGVGVKDSSNLLPGHGGLFDRLDALMLAAPVFLAGLCWLGWIGAP